MSHLNSSKLLLKHFFYSFIFLYAFTGCDNNEQLFTQLSPSSTGIKFQNILQETDEFNVLTYGYLYNGGGVAVGDINNDSLPDLYFTGNMVGSRLYLNNGDFKFEEIAKNAGVFAEGNWNTGATMADVNGDGYLDIYVCKSAALNPERRRNQLFINNGDLTFTEMGKKYGVDDSGYSTQAAFFDYDNDGDLDLYILNHSTQEFAGLGKISKHNKNRKNKAYSDKLMKNDNGKFIDVSDEVGLISNVLGFGLGIAISDLNNDGWLDIYISNDYNEQDYLYFNNGDGTFKESLEDYIGHVSLYSMGSDIADINNDGFTDIMTLDMLPEHNYRIKMTSGPDNYEKLSYLSKNGFYHQTMRNMLHLNQGGDYFSEIGQFSGISNTVWSWASLFTDLDNDGYKDLFITNGYKKDYTNMDFMNYVVQERINEKKSNEKINLTELIKKMPSTIEENYTYKNNGDLTFTKVNKAWGLDQKTLSNGAAYVDLDNDGDMDLVVNNIDEKASIFRNNSEKLTQNNYLKIALEGEGKNKFGVGSKVKVTSGEMTQTQELLNTRGYQSSVDFNLNFGVGKSKIIDRIEVVWPNQKKQVITAVQPNQKLTLFQKDATINVERKTLTKPKLFQEATPIDFTHKENNYNDFKREIMLPHMLSTLGPKLAVGDVNGDGLEDAFIGGAKGASGAIFLQTRLGGFVKSSKIDLESDAASEDMGAIFFDADGDRDLDLFVVSGGNEFEKTDPNLKDRLYINKGKGNFIKSKGNLPDYVTSGSIVKAADYDSDGDLDLFVGGRILPNEYPYAPQSSLLQNNGIGVFQDVTESIAIGLKNIGMVSDALWTDFNGDNLPDLMLVGEWMPLTLFINQNGNFENISERVGFKNSEGWWNAIEQGDFDHDGDMDYVAGNFGLNSQLKTSVKYPIGIYAKDYDNNGSVDPILSCYDEGKNYPVFSKDDIQQQLTILKNRFVKYNEYAGLTIDQVFTPKELEGAKVLYAKNFETSYIENLGNGQFKISALPKESQFSPIHGLSLGDFNQDGNLDVLLGGNFTASRVKFGHYDAIKGICFLGDGRGQFSYLDASESGLMVSGEVRDIQKITSPNGEKYFVFSRNNNTPKIYKQQLN
ncbi:MAG: VCBS repeat-containing protein [Flavobacteriaceae bacterium]|nr:VCBS repeat-containing protein [Flavobacteriaceae bacterium]